MYHKTLTIDSKPSREGQKTRTFTAEVLAWVTANPLWELGATCKERRLRPVFLALAAPVSASRAFLANLQCGHIATEPHGSYGLRFEIPRSAGFRYESTNRAGGTLTLIYLPQIFSMQPGTTERDSIAFVCMPPTAWVDDQAALIASSLGSDAREAAIAAYFVAYLDARTALPIANDLRFHLKLFRAAMEQGWCELSVGRDSDPGLLYAVGVSSIGFEAPVMCNVAPDTFADFLAEQTAKHLPKELRNEEILHGSPRLDRTRRILPNPHPSPAQSGLFGAVPTS
jgi:hypothetical protein